MKRENKIKSTVNDLDTNFLKYLGQCHSNKYVLAKERMSVV